MDIKKEIKKLLVEENTTLVDVVKALNIKNNTKYTVQAYSNKIIRETLRITEFEDILSVLGYSVTITKNNK